MGLFTPLFEELNAADARYVVVGGFAVVLHGRPEDTPLGVGEGGAHRRMQGALVALDSQHIVGPRGSQGLHDGPLAAGGVDRDDGSLQDHAVESAGDGRDRIALGLTGLLGQGQALPNQADRGR